MQHRCIRLLAAIVLATVLPCASATTLLRSTLVDSLPLANASSSGFRNIVLRADGIPDTVQVGTTPLLTRGVQTTISLVSRDGGNLKSTPSKLVALSNASAIAHTDYPMPRLILGGDYTKNSMVYSRILMSCGPELEPCLQRDSPVGEPVAIDIARSGALHDVDLIVGGGQYVAYLAFGVTQPRWSQYVTRVSGLAVLPSRQSVAVLATTLQIRDANTGDLQQEIAWQGSWLPRTIKVVRFGDSEPKLVVADGDVGVAAFGTAPLRLLWHRTDASYYPAMTLVDAVPGGGGEQHILIVDNQGKLIRLDGQGVTVAHGSSINTNARNFGVLHGSDGTHVVCPTFPENDGGLVSFDAATLGTQTGYQGRYSDNSTRTLLTDPAGDGVAKLVSLAQKKRQGGSDSWLRIVDAQTYREDWAGMFDIGSTFSDGDTFIDLDAGRAIAGNGRRIYLLGGPYGLGYGEHITLVDGRTRTMLWRKPVPVPEDRVARNLRSFISNGQEKLAIVSSASSSSATGIRVHILAADTLSLEWTSPILSADVAVTWLAVSPAANGSNPLLHVALANTGVYAIDLAARQIRYGIPAKPLAGTMQNHPNGQRIVYIDGSASPSLESIDPQTGTSIASQPLPRRYFAIAADPANPDLFVVAEEDRLCAYNVLRGSCDGYSPMIGSWSDPAGFYAAKSDFILSRVNNGQSQFLVDTPFGTWLNTYADDRIFAAGFDSAVTP